MTPGEGEVAMTFSVTVPPAEVWSLVRRFVGVATWNPVLASSRLASGIDGEVGAERQVVTSGGTTVRERLEVVDDAAREIGYRMLTFPIPVAGQTNGIAVASDGGRSRVSSGARFVPAPRALEEDVAEINRSAFVATANGIGARLGATVSVVQEWAASGGPRPTGAAKTYEEEMP